MADHLQPDYQVDVAHPGSVNTTYAMVGGLAQMGLLGRFDTGFYYKQDQWHWLLELLPNSVGQAMVREFKRRQSPGLPAEKIFQRPFWEFFCVAAARFGASGSSVRFLRDQRNAKFDRVIAGQLSRGRHPDLMVVQDGSALQSLRAAKQTGVTTALNQVIGHFSHGREILLEEEARFPKLKGQLVEKRSSVFLESVVQEPAAADWIFAPSDYVRDTVVALGAASAKVLKLPYCVDTGRFKVVEKSTDRAGPCRLLFVGQISQRKGVLYLLEAIKQLNDPEIEVTFVGNIDGGSGAGSDWLSDYRECFRHLTNVPYGEVHALYRQADVFVYPSLHEGSPMAIFEAMASGLPVITTPNSGSVIRDGKEGFIVPIRDVTALKEKIVQLKEDSCLRKQMGMAARALAEQHDLVHYQENLIECLRTIKNFSGDS